MYINLIDSQIFIIQNSFDLPLGNKITTGWLKDNVKLTGYKILCFSNDSPEIEIDDAESWEDEHGIRTLWENYAIIALGEGGIVW